jgi:hypothetical protein
MKNAGREGTRGEVYAEWKDERRVVVNRQVEIDIGKFRVLHLPRGRGLRR